MRREARRLRLPTAKVKYALSESAEWIAHQYDRQLPMLDGHILDYYHLREHVVQTSQVAVRGGHPEGRGVARGDDGLCVGARLAGAAGSTGFVSTGAS